MSDIHLDYINQKDRDRFTTFYDKNHLSSDSLTVKDYSDCVILPNTNNNGGVYQSGHFIYNSSLHRNWVQNFPENIEPDEISNSEVVYLGMFHDIWGHCITDNLKHLWFLNNTEYDYLKKYKFVYCTIKDDFSFSDNFTELLSFLGIQTDQLFRITKPTAFSKVYIPDECFFYNENCNTYQYTKEYASIIEKICCFSVSDNSPEKIYFSRTHIKNHKDVGEAQIEQLFSDNDFMIVHPEQLSFSKTLSLLSNCSCFASTEGSISHNSIFCPGECKIILLRKYKGSFNDYQLTLDSVRNHDVTLIDCSKSTFADKIKPWAGPFFLYQSKNLTDFFKTKHKRFPFVFYVTEYWLYWLLRRIKHSIFRK